MFQICYLAIVLSTSFPIHYPHKKHLVEQAQGSRHNVEQVSELIHNLDKLFQIYFSLKIRISFTYRSNSLSADFSFQAISQAQKKAMLFFYLLSYPCITHSTAHISVPTIVPDFPLPYQNKDDKQFSFFKQGFYVDHEVCIVNRNKGSCLDIWYLPVYFYSW